MPIQDSEAERRVAVLERRIAAAEARLRQAVYYNQTAAQGGSHIIAQMIRGASGGLSSVLVADFGNELITAYDANGIARAEFGNMPARGISPAQWGERANDANGNPIFDSMGLISVASVLASTSFGASTTSAASFGTYVTITNSLTNFSLTRSATVLVLAEITGKTTSTGAGAYTYPVIGVDGTNQAISTLLFDKAVTGYTNGASVALATLAAGSHNAEWRLTTDDNTTSLVVWGGEVYVVLMGA